ncbi:hypothetical protein [Streptomyces sp. NBC_01373]|uniref:hypothetical protein n=1 Tax=Streptomyces sp. NBC_01373 TaxID=2903843 RepID=UPI00225B8F70|nr:hypothetical protein [Streptomyces sp. NBC_01373]MCX4703856.1 hypothetical protein [Streptomyces sp. NBC_01373]
MDYPFYRIHAEGPNETELNIDMHYVEGNGGLTAANAFDAADYLRDHLEGLTDVTTSMSHHVVTTTSV